MRWRAAAHPAALHAGARALQPHASTFITQMHSIKRPSPRCMRSLPRLQAPAPGSIKARVLQQACARKLQV